MIFSSAGRIGPLRFALVAVAGWCVWRAAVWAFDRGETATYLLVGAGLGAVLAWVAAEAGRRLHDTGWRGGWSLIVALAVAAPPVALTPTALAYDPHWLMPALQVFALLILAVLLFRPGARVANRFGEPPMRPFGHARAPDGMRPARAAAWACVSVAGCALLALAIINISHGMRDAREHDLRQEQERER